MSCPSVRLICNEQVQCVRPLGHSGGRHKGILEDLTEILWDGAPGSMFLEGVNPDASPGAPTGGS